jgi:hypothetical protein
VPITYSTPSSITIEIDGRTVEIDAQGYLRGRGSPDFVVYSSSIVRWSDGAKISHEDKDRILDDLRRSAKEKGWSIEIA